MDYLENYLEIDNIFERMQHIQNKKNISEEQLYKVLKLKSEVKSFLEKFKSLFNEEEKNGHYM